MYRVLPEINQCDACPGQWMPANILLHHPPCQGSVQRLDQEGRSRILCVSDGLTTYKCPTPMVVRISLRTVSPRPKENFPLDIRDTLGRLMVIADPPTKRLTRRGSWHARAKTQVRVQANLNPRIAYRAPRLEVFSFLNPCRKDANPAQAFLHSACQTSRFICELPTQ